MSQRQVTGNVVTFYGYDGLGSVRFLTDASGAITNTYVYDAFGTAIVSNAPIANVYLSAGEQWDPDLGLYYLRARYYSPQLGRFWTMDTCEGDETAPLSLNKYSYARNNAVNLADPTGCYSSWEQFLGYDAEKAIDDEYLAMHIGQKGFIDFGREQQGISAYLKPDIVNRFPSERHFMEIKPISSSGVAKGIAKIALDAEFYRGTGFSADTKWEPVSHTVRTPNGHLIFVVNVWGILFYQDVDLLEWQLIAAAVITTPRELLDYLMVANADALGELAPVYSRARIAQRNISTLYNAEIEDDLGMGTLEAEEGAE
jgi:RHS repeat-associated protein